MKQVRRAYKGRLGRRDRWALKVQMARVARKVIRVMQGHKVLPEHKVRKVKLVQLDQMEFRGQPDQQELMERLALKVRKELLGRREQ